MSSRASGHKDGDVAATFGRSGPVMASGDALKSQDSYLKRCLTHQGEDEWHDHYISQVTDNGRMEVVDMLIKELERNVEGKVSHADEMVELMKALRALREESIFEEGEPILERLFSLRLTPQVLRGSKVSKEVAAWRASDHSGSADLATRLMEKWKEQLRLANKQADTRNLRNTATQIEKELYSHSMIGSNKYSRSGVKPEKKYNKILSFIRRMLKDPKKQRMVLDRTYTTKELVITATSLAGIS